FLQDQSASAQALVASNNGICGTTNNSIAALGGPGGYNRVYLLAAAAGNPSFPSSDVDVQLNYTDGTIVHNQPTEVQSGQSGLIEFSSWGGNGRPDLAVYSASTTLSGTPVAYVYMYSVPADPTKA